ncbi:von Willebrand factor C domain-containing protein 2-like [Rhinatrema bivittatum]|uniref:von Willebrand factor C domain-containing protein 2-like n=1 Tax=Rhinatrema bivittatum TaxID=194408 RepID=UPI001126F1A7|nr:von Willebrand factor C domain-containing protein 2-like [Rhinatrema bivittatum]
MRARRLVLSLWLLLLLAPRGSRGSALAGQPGTCEANGSLYYAGEWYFLDSDPCTQCECTAEGPACARTECAALPAACMHVSHYPSDCCPRCEKIGCEHRGRVYELGEAFQPSECEQCTCEPDGIARCLVADCAPPPCVNAVYETGECCPKCIQGPNCYADSTQSRIIPAGDHVWVDSCTKCQCHDGQDVGYWEGNRVAKCETPQNCKPEAGVHKS